VEIAKQHWELVVFSMEETGVIRVFAKDITTRKQMEARLLHADRMAALGSLAARVGHEMNNPLAYLMANLSFAREEINRLRQALRANPREETLEEFDEVLEALGESWDGADRLRVIVQDLHLLVREPPTHRAWVDVHQVLEDSLKLVRNDLRHRARLEKDFQPVPLVEADEARLGQVFLNLLVNAGQALAGRRNASVKVVTAREGTRIRVAIADNGPGIPARDQGRIFDAFFTTKPPGAGSGLGLSISREIVRRHGGELTVESEEGRGSRFVVTLPAAVLQ
jgi:signal transduction histidine kinase